MLLASLFGALIGLEREHKNWSAGMRTHMMVCMGACLIMMVSAFGFADVLNEEHIALDPSRIAAQVVSGIGFIGAGTIIFQKQGTIRGLTTASGLWTVAAIGLATGGGIYLAAAMAMVIAIIILWALQPLEKKYAKRFAHKSLRIVTFPNLGEVDIINDLLNVNHFEVRSFNLEKYKEQYIFNVVFESADSEKINELLSSLKNQPCVKEVYLG
ncbi:MgtC/SapB family protein [Elizabethkingia sp. JS20170427COW]|uniref:MgtC/SapB family protein n=1 Tax=Elizabethkingia sp. JS20170427COW TaxID=2583851 RepID=UPI002106F18F|nr:MgtC/SapB family protein [Elizabethkingia sp. JS20170427COW]